MKKIVVIYYSGTGNTEAMAEAVVSGIDNSGSEVEVNMLNVSEASIDDVKNADAVALGCPSMGDEVLEEVEMEPFVESISEEVSGKPVVLFGSYDWGNGEWMEKWEVRMMGYGAALADSGLIVNLQPDEEALVKCNQLGSTLVAAL